MRTIKFKKNCRHCVKSNGLDNFYSEVGEELDFNKSLTDYEMSYRISNFLKEKQINCEFCESNNFDINEIRVDDYEIFSYDRLTDFDFYYDYRDNDTEHLAIEINKFDRKLSRNIGASIKRSAELFQSFKIFFLNHALSLPDSDFQDNANGKIYVCLTRKQNKIQIEKFRHYGFSKAGVLQRSQTVFNQCIEHVQ